MTARRRRRGPVGTRLAGRVVLGMVLAVTGFLTLRFLLADDGYPALLTLRGELRDLQVEVRDLDRTNRRLRRAIDALHHDPYAVEKIARENLDLVAPGEILYLFPAEPSPGGVTEPDAGTERP